MAEIPNGSATAQTLAPIGEWREHREGVKALALSPDGRWTVGAATDRQTVVWRDGKPVRRFEPFAFWEIYPANRHVYDLAISRNSDVLFVAASDRLMAYDLESGRRQWRFRGPRLLAFLPANPVGMAVCPANGTLAVGFDDGHMGLWTPEGQSLGFWYDEQGPRRLAFTRDGSQIMGCDLHSICIWDTASHAKVARHLSRKQIHALTLSPVDDVAASRDLYEIAIWRNESGAEMARFSVEPGLPLLAFSPTQNILAYSSGAAVELRTFEGREVGRVALEGVRPLSLAFSPDGTALLIGSSDGAVRRFAVSAG